jgi:hypothetical protein
MDLFGDLPVAKKNCGGGGTSCTLFGGLPAAASSASAAGEANAQQIGKENTSETDNTKTSAAAEGSAASSEKRKSTASLVSVVGKAGTSLAFVPQAISQARKKKKLSSQQSTKKVETYKANVEAEGKEKSETLKNSEYALKSNAVDESISTQHESNEIDDREQSSEEPYLENEPESIRLLHESVTPANAYNPHFPNDYLAHLERKKTERIQRELQHSALQRVEQQERLRKKIEEERKKIESSGDLNKIVEMRAGIGGENTTGLGGAGRGRGRGRGVQNLPAWLVKKQQEQQRAAEESSLSNAPIVPIGQFGDADDDDDDENCVITLFNMVAPGEIDEHLATDIREECEEQSLKVVDIKIFDASSTSDFVRADITFADGMAARDAVRLFNGRKFGDRQVTAEIME